MSRIFASIIGSIVIAQTAADPCWDLCSLVPGSCGEEGSLCIDGVVCLDLFWMTEKAICNSGVAGCIEKPHVSCDEATAIVDSQNAQGVTAFVSGDAAPGLGGASWMDALGFSGFEFGNIDEPWFLVDGDATVGEEQKGGEENAAERVPGRKGILNLGETCYLASALQVILHSRAIRDAIAMDRASGTAPMWHPVYYHFVNLLDEMYDTRSSRPLNLRNLLDALHETNGGLAFENRSDDSFQALMMMLRILAEFSPNIAEVVQLETSGTRLCAACEETTDIRAERLGYQLVRFPGTSEQYSIPEMLRAHFETGNGVELFCGTCAENTDQVEFPIVSKLPQLLIIAVNRYTYTAEKITTSLDSPLEITMEGVVPGGEEIRYRLVGIERHMGNHWLLDYLDSDRNEWIHSNDEWIHVIKERPRNGGPDPAIIFYERI